MHKLLYADATRIEDSRTWVITVKVDGEPEEETYRRSVKLATEKSARRIFDATVADFEGIARVRLFEVSLQGWKRMEEYDGR